MTEGAPPAGEARARRAKVAIAAIIGLGVLLRLAWVASPGFPTDVGTFAAWAERLAELGPGGFYEPGYFSDYPPAFLYVLWLLGALFDGEVLRLVIKGSSIPFDVAIALVTAAFVQRRAGAPAAVVSTALWMLLPGPAYAGTYWGQVDAVGTLPLLLAALAAGSRRWFLAGVLAATCALVKPQFGIGAIVLGAAAAFAFVREAQWRTAARFVAGGAIATLALSLPFRTDPLQLVTLVREAAGTYPYTSLYALNPWSVIGGFWSPDDSFVLIGGVLLFLGVAAASATLWRRRDVETILAACALAVLAFYFLPTRAHERYLYPAFALLLPFAATRRGVLIPYLVLAAGFFASLVLVLSRYDLVEPPGLIDATLFSRSGEIVLALAMSGAAAWIAFLAARGRLGVGARAAIEGLVISRRRWSLPSGLAPGRAPTRRDVLVALAVALVVLGTRGFRLDHPRDMYFDEVYHARTAFELIAQREPYEWTHPLLAKQLIALGILGFGADRAVGREDAPADVVAFAVSQGGERAYVLRDGRVIVRARSGTEDERGRAAGAIALIFDGDRLMAADRCAVSLVATGAARTTGPGCSLGDIRSVAVAAGRFAAAGTNGTSIFSTEFTQPPVVALGPAVAVTAKPDGSAFYVLDPSGAVRVIDPISGATTRSYPGERPGVAIAYGQGPDRLFVALADEPALDVIEVDTGGRERMRLANARTGTFQSGATALAVVPRTQFLYALADGRVVVVETHGASPYAAIPVRGTMLGIDGDADELLVAGPDGIERVETGRHALAWRLPGVVAAAVLAFFLVLLARRLFASPIAPALVGAFVVLDGSMFSQARIAMNDIYVAAFIVVGWYFVVAAHRPRRSATLDLVIAGAAFGLALASKWVAAYALVGVGLLALAETAAGYMRGRRGTGGPLDLLADVRDGSENLEDRRARAPFVLDLWGLNLARLALCFGILPIAIYLAHYLPWFGGPTIPYGWDLRELTTQMYGYHANLTAAHPAGAPWWSWPLVIKPTYWYYAASDGGGSAVIYNAGNVVLFWAALAATIWCAVAAVRARSVALGFVVFALLAQFLAWIPISRVVFFYHFFTALPFYFLALAAGCVALWETGRRMSLGAFLALAAGAFAYFYPFVSGQPVPAEQSGVFFILPTWQYDCQFYPAFVCPIGTAPFVAGVAVLERAVSAIVAIVLVAGAGAAIVQRERVGAWLAARLPAQGRS